jgi:hypothetical protein
LGARRKAGEGKGYLVILDGEVHELDFDRVEGAGPHANEEVVRGRGGRVQC